ncbi:prepilin peptidase [Planctomicrobium sp. SH661]|uniref:prepilin peptidase n=1 Tax=Planctomicrobium sp. SH661 TaxID=3448124 RepID=UPI003F5B4B68
MLAVDAIPHLRLDLPAWMILSYLFILGAVVGSFLNVCIYRIPTQDRFLDQLKALSNRPSHCPRCKTNIRWFDNIPIFGWLKLRGRCRACRMWISPRYPLIEFLNGCLWVLLFWMEVPMGMQSTLAESCVYSDLGPQVYPGLGFLSPEWFVILRFFSHLVLVEALLVASFIDFDLRIIPDGSTLPAMIFAVLFSWLIARVHLVPVWFQSSNLEQSFAAVTPEWIHPLMRGNEVPEWVTAHPHLHGLLVSLAGLLVGGGIVWGVRLLGFWMLRQEAMGFGDVILMAMIGAFIGWQASIIAFFIAPMCAIAVVAWTYLVNLTNRLFGRRDSFVRMIPYGPYLSLGALLTILFWQELFDRTRHFFELGVLLIPFALIMGILFGASLFLVQGLKRLLGIQSYEEFPAAAWRSADQTWFFKGETVDRHTCRWKTRDWDGCASGQGMIHQERWRSGGAGNGFTANHWRRPDR